MAPSLLLMFEPKLVQTSRENNDRINMTDDLKQKQIPDGYMD